MLLDGIVVERAALEVVGQIGCTGLPDAFGVVEVHYATVQGHSDLGLATDAGGAFVDWLLVGM